MAGADYQAKIEELGGTLHGGINWDWAHFLEKEKAEAFDNWCHEVGFETRGVYPPSNDIFWGVRFR